MLRSCTGLILIGFFNFAHAENPPVPGHSLSMDPGTAVFVIHDTKIEARTSNGGRAAVPTARGAKLTVVSVNPDGTITAVNDFGFQGKISQSDVGNTMPVGEDSTAATPPTGSVAPTTESASTASASPASGSGTPPDAPKPAPTASAPLNAQTVLPHAADNVPFAPVFDDLSDKLAEAKREKKPLLLFLVNESNAVSKKVDLESMADPAVKKALGGYVFARKTFHLVRARTITADGKENPVAPSDVRTAPVYSDLPYLDAVRQVKFSFPGARKGTFVDFEYERTSGAKMRGEYSLFWTIESSGIPVLDSRLRLEIPTALAPQYRVVKNSGPVQKEVKGDETILTWSGHSEPADSSTDANAAQDSQTPGLSVQSYLEIATKLDWSDVGKWFLGLTDPERTHSPEMDAWIDRQTQGVEPGSDYERRLTDAILGGFYREFRYLHVPLNETGYQPHSVADTFKNKWGDCKDFALFLQECLKRKGIASDLVLLNPTTVIDFSQEFPSPNYFNHCILHVGTESGGFFVDPTSRLFAGVLPTQETEITGLLCRPAESIPIKFPTLADDAPAAQTHLIVSGLNEGVPHVAMDIRLVGPDKLAMREISKMYSGAILEGAVVGRILEETRKSGNFHSTDFRMTGDNDSEEPMTLHLEGTLSDLFTTSGDLLIAPTVINNNDRFFAGLPSFADSTNQERVLLTGSRHPPVYQCVTYRLPTGIEVFEAPKPFQVDTGYFKVERTISQSANEISVTTAITPKYVPGEPTYVHESSLPAEAQGLVSRLSQPIVFRRSAEQQLRQASNGGDNSQVADLLATTKDVESPDSHGYTLLIDAADADKAELIRQLLAKGAKINATDKRRCTALLHACNTDSQEAALALINGGANCNLASSAGQTPLMYAAGSGDVVLVKALIDHHVNANATSNAGPALLWAAYMGKGAIHNRTAADQAEVVRLLLAAGADPNKGEGHNTKKKKQGPKTPLAVVAALGNMPVLNQILSSGAPADVPDSAGVTPLMLAAQEGQTAAVDALLTHGAKAGRQDVKGLSVLMYGGASTKADLIQDLIKHGADVNAVCAVDGTTALMHACRAQNSNLDVVKQLVESGAKVAVADKSGETAVNYAANVGKADVVAYLNSQGAPQVTTHIIASTAGPSTLSPARAWALGLAAIYMQKYGENFNYLGGHAPDQRVAPGVEKRALYQGWSVKNKADLLYQLNELQDNGHRSRFLAEGKTLADKPDGEFQNFVSNPLFDPKKVAEIRALRDSYLKWSDRTGLAFDLCRYVNLVSMGFAAGYLRQSEAWSLIQPVALLAQRNFASWSEMGQNFLDGRKIWASTDDPDFAACYKLLANSQDPNSPWTRNPWNCDLTSLADPQTTSAAP